MNRITLKNLMRFVIALLLFRGVAVPAEAIVADPPSGGWTVTRHDVPNMQSQVISEDAAGRFMFDAPAGRAVPFRFQKK